MSKRSGLTQPGDVPLEYGDTCSYYSSVVAECLMRVQERGEHALMVRDRLIRALREWSDGGQSEQSIVQLIGAYRLATQFYPDSELMLNDAGGICFRFGLTGDALTYFHSALSVAPQFLGAQENLDNLCCHLVDRWHFRMLNDACRNSTYRSAIWRAVVGLSHRGGGQEARPVDIGAGTGLLSLYATEADVSVRVTSCEMSRTMCDLATDIVSHHGLSDRITLVNERSTDLLAPPGDQARFNICITEIFDAGLFGEGVLKTMHHAWEHLLEPKSLVIPSGATVYVSAIECNALHQRNRFLHARNCRLSMDGIEIFCSTGHQNSVNHPPHNYPHSGTKSHSNQHSDCDIDCENESDTEEEEEEEVEEECFEPYTSERLDRVPGGFDLLSEPTQILDVHFDDPLDVERFHKGNVSKMITIPISSPGRLDALAVWFDLRLDPDSCLMTSPLANNDSGKRTVCWEQAVYPVLRRHLAASCGVLNPLLSASHYKTSDKQDSSDVQVSSGDTLHICLTVDDALRLQCIGHTLCVSATADCVVTSADVLESCPGCSADQSVTRCTVCDKIINGDLKADVNVECLDGDSLKELESDSFYLDAAVVRILNDRRWSNACFDALSAIHENFAYKCRTQSTVTSNPCETGSKFRILDLTPHFSLLPIQSLLLLADEVCIAAQDSTNRKLCSRLLTANGIEAERLVCDGEGERGREGGWSVVVADVVEASGCLRQHVLEDIALARETRLSGEGVIMPTSVTVRGRLVHSLPLLEDSRLVDDSRTQPFSITQYINQFQSRTHRDIDLSTLRHVPLTDDFTLFTLHFNPAEPLLPTSTPPHASHPTPPHDSSEVFSACAFPSNSPEGSMTTLVDPRVTNGCESNRSSQSKLKQPISGNMPSFLDVKQLTNVTAVESGSVTAVVYWFDISLTESITVSTFGLSFDHPDGTSGDIASDHWRQAAVMLTDEGLTVSKGDVVCVDAFCNNSHIGANVKLL